MFEKISPWLKKILSFGKAASDVTTAAGSIKDAAATPGGKEKVFATVKAVGDVSSATDSLKDASES